MSNNRPDKNKYGVGADPYKQCHPINLKKKHIYTFTKP